MERSCHPLLRGGRRGNKYSHGFSRAEMESLASVCEAILPPLPLNSLQLTQKAAHTNNRAIQFFHKASGSQNSVPEEVAELIETRGFFEAVMLLRVVLTILSTRLGTFLLCGLKVTEDPKQNLYRVQCDAVIVGSGCGGGVAAAVLASSGLKVVVLEKGNYFHSTDYSLLEGPSMNQLYEGGGIFSTLDGKMMLLAGSTVGGGSAVNWSACIRTPKIVLQEWAQEHKLSLFESPSIFLLWIRCGKELGLQRNALNKDFRIRSSKKGVKSSAWTLRQWPETPQRITTVVLAVLAAGQETSRALIPPEKNKHGGIRSKKCLGVIAKSLNKSITRRLEIEAKVTVSACGSLLTPPLMISSGLKNKHIGRNLRLHPVLMAWGYFPESNSEFKGKVTDGGIITSVHKVVSEEFNVRALVETPALAPGQYAALCPWESGLDIKSRILKYSRTALLFSMIRDRGSGEVKGEGRVSYTFDKLDKENMKAGLRRVLEILVAAGAVEVGTHRSDGQRIKCQGISKEELDEFLDAVCANHGPKSMVENWTTYCSAHQMGSCRMGRSKTEGAVDENGESWEAEGLFVCDASVLPSAVGVNPMITIQSTAYCLSKKIAQSLAKK
ncbi:fatty alcohol oxidase 3 [Actinidia rufa]|uniref:Long-chain-alcohol oxidase n=1 Tax=Actinidia rufa TaxID=165716 RepID=A0A7J0F356_9ERIC|nr:fatty alcohol oxidase 3 [Actinidia rufa]